ncbi:HlyD family secretion protein [Thioalkalivibrio nitratireducens DSM 14787]|uniref:HlyD family secretion protein n=1 Tax=Thioalkalivibrio nitratireducens (strain DSM 14787 / UNIQEM 213 / ALEN2) TaxID=1255043 RepID=L0DYM5_THIND|nr:efflux RND transporter periplasmic adaptor subunit [Thioalkalivibrio nitratireducens]AGA34153.1 HlyD family secretion protein [Thioalkalivibrio nitratireducens DSM 14787]
MLQTGSWYRRLLNFWGTGGFSLRAAAIAAGLGVVLLVLVLLPASGTRLPDGVAGTPVVESDLLLEVRAQGVLRARGQIAVHPQVTGVVAEVADGVAAGDDRVRSGAWLVRIEDTDLRLAFEEAQSAWLAAQGDAAAARGRAQRARQERERSERLLRERLIPRDERDQAVANQEELETALEIAEAHVEQARIRRDRAAENLQRSVVASPIDGVLLSLFAEPGQPVSPAGGQPLFEVAPSLEALELRLEVNEADIGRVASGQSVRFTVEAFPGREFPGQVRSVRAGGQRQGGITVYDVVVNVDNADRELFPGMSAQARIETGRSGRLPVIPLKALLYRPDPAVLRGHEGELERLRASGKAVIWTSGPRGELHPVGVRLGVQDESQVALVDAWEHGDDVLVLYRE